MNLHLNWAIKSHFRKVILLTLSGSGGDINNTIREVEDALSGLRQFLAVENPLKL